MRDDWTVTVTLTVGEVQAIADARSDPACPYPKGLRVKMMAALVPLRGAVSWELDDDRYYVRVWDEKGDLVEEYTAGNHPRSSATDDCLPPEDERAVSVAELRKFAQSTARLMAHECGLDPRVIREEEGGAS